MPPSREGSTAHVTRHGASDAPPSPVSGMTSGPPRTMVRVTSLANPGQIRAYLGFRRVGDLTNNRDLGIRNVVPSFDAHGLEPSTPEAPRSGPSPSAPQE